MEGNQLTDEMFHMKKPAQVKDDGGPVKLEEPSPETLKEASKYEESSRTCVCVSDKSIKRAGFRWPFSLFNSDLIKCCQTHLKKTFMLIN